LHDELGNDRPIAERPPSAGLDDLVIVPLVLIAVAISKLLKAVFSILIYVLDYAFPILLQLMRIPLLTARVLGDGMELFLETVLQCLPVSSAKRDAWRARVRQQWIWFRRNISYQAFEQALHHAFEAGMAWVFRKCRRLTPSGALLVLAVAFLWLPVSFGTATALHAILIAQAKSLSAWMQLLHPFATVIAKSKLLVLPVYPAAWPQAKEHPFVQRFFQFCGYCMNLDILRKARYRYQQTERGAAVVANSVGRSASVWRIGSKRCGFLLLTCSHGSASPGPTSCCGCSKRFPEVRSSARSWTATSHDMEACTRRHRASKSVDCLNDGRSSFRPTTMRQRIERKVETVRVWVSCFLVKSCRGLPQRGHYTLWPATSPA
jgi:hypothetical protein